jgi:hypothetical protein
VDHPYPTFMAATKAISFFPGWSLPDQADYIWFDAVLEIGGVTEAGFTLHGGCYRHQPDRHVTMELRVRRVPGRRCIPLSRVCWRSLTGHTNRRGTGPPELAGKRMPDTHHHAFDLNWLPSESRMRNTNLPLARAVEGRLESFEDLMSYVGNAFNISNIDIVTPPEWEHMLV